MRSAPAGWRPCTWRRICGTTVEVALKLLRPELSAVIGAERFLAEIKLTANLQHPHILPLFDSGEADGFFFYVMPLDAGDAGPRAEVMRRPNPSHSDAASVSLR